MDTADCAAYGNLAGMPAEPSELAARAFAGVLQRFGTLGLPDVDMRRVLMHYFEDGGAWDLAAAAGTAELESRAIEQQDLVALLLEYSSDASDESRWIAHTVATACLGENHLWQDMGLPNRDALSALLRCHFRALVELNTQNMKWKKFFYKQLCKRAGVNVCKAPSCGVCVDYAKCFGQE
jgi:nitrogen fixation protein NifQ